MQTILFSYFLRVKGRASLQNRLQWRN